MTTTIAFSAGVLVTLIGMAMVTIVRGGLPGHRRPGPDPAPDLAPDLAPGGALRPGSDADGRGGDAADRSDAPGTAAGDPDGSSAETRLWREQCVRLQLSEEYVATQTRQIIDEYAALMSSALAEAIERTQALRSATDSASGVSGDTQSVARSVAVEAHRAETLLATLAESLAKVEQMADFINSVASRTNLLSLNATIEAARAGAAGRGFAVVAQEVKELATATGKATTDITDTVEELRREAVDVEAALRGMASDVGRMDDMASRVTRAMENQRTALEELDVQVNTVSSQADLLALLVRNVDRRRHDRIAGCGTVTLAARGASIETSMLDVSSSGLGCALMRSVPLEVGAQITATWPTSEGVLSMSAVVRRRAPSQGRDHVGLEFTSVTDEQAAAIQRYIADLLEADGESDQGVDAAGIDAPAW